MKPYGSRVASASVSTCSAVRKCGWFRSGRGSFTPDAGFCFTARPSTASSKMSRNTSTVFAIVFGLNPRSTIDATNAFTSGRSP